MIYLWPQASSMVGMSPQFGVMTSPAHGSVPLGIQEGRPFGVDNEAFTQGFRPDRFFSYLEQLQPYRNQWLFSACPDVLGDARLTIGLYGAFAHKIKPYSPVAFVAQDGQEALDFPLAFDWLFIGGTTKWKMGDGADICIRRAKALGKPVHVGRINSISRFRHFQLMEVDSCDGTFPTYEPDTARKRLAKAVRQHALFSLR